MSGRAIRRSRSRDNQISPIQNLSPFTMQPQVADSMSERGVSQFEGSVQGSNS